MRSERAFCEELEYNLLFRWFLDMNLMERSFDPTVFTKNRQRLLEHRTGQALLDEVVLEADRRGLLSDEHFSVDGTLIEAAASIKSFRRRDEEEQPHDDDPGNPSVDFRGERLRNETHESGTDPEARLMLERALERGHLQAGWVAGDDAFGMSPSFREGLAALGMRYVLDGPAGFTVWPAEPEWSNPAYQGQGHPRKPKLVDGQRRTMAERADATPDDAWREIKVAQGSQGPRTYQFSAHRVRPTVRRKPGEIHWAVYRRNQGGSEPRYYLSNAPENTPLETLAYVGGSRWRIETEFETEKGDVGLDEYETRSWAGWHHHIAMCLLGGAFLLGLQQDWGGKDAPDHPSAGVPGSA